MCRGTTSRYSASAVWLWSCSLQAIGLAIKQLSSPIRHALAYRVWLKKGTTAAECIVRQAGRGAWTVSREAVQERNASPRRRTNNFRQRATCNAGNRHKTQDACSVIQVAVARCINTNESTTTTMEKTMMRPQRSQHNEEQKEKEKQERQEKHCERQQQQEQAMATAMGNRQHPRLAMRRLQQRRLWHWPYTSAHTHTYTQTYMRPP